MKKSKTILLVLSLWLFSCQHDSTSNPDLEDLRGQQLKNVFRNEIQPTHAKFQAACLKLKEETQKFVIQSSVENLMQLRTQWLATILSWKHCELYNLGPIDKKFLHYLIDKWPVNKANIEKFISGTAVINEAFITSKGSNTKGLAAIEYLLYKDQRSEAEILTDFSSQRRLKYLEHLVGSLYNLSIEINEIWAVYQKEFESQTSKNPGVGQNILINNQVALVEEILREKIDTPLDNKKSKGVESPHGLVSLALIRGNLESIERIFTGDFNKNSNGVGFDGFLRFSASPDLSKKIINQIEVCYKALDQIEGPLFNAVVTQKKRVSHLRLAIRDLVILIKVDMASALNATITLTDSDGD